MINVHLAFAQGLRFRLEQMRPDSAGRRSLRGYSRQEPTSRFLAELIGNQEPVVTQSSSDGAAGAPVTAIPDDVFWL
jgi:hypothetical protein